MLKTKNGRIEIDDNGYLEEYELKNQLVNSVSSFYSEAISLNNNICKLLFEMNATKGDGVGTFYLGTIQRMHKDYQSALILICRGLQSQARSIIRNLVEKTFILKAIDNNHEYLESWVRTQNNERNRTIKIITNRCADLIDAEQEKDLLEESKDTEQVSFRRWADRAEMIYDYNVIYHILCSDTHHTMSGMNKDAFAEEKEFAGFSIAPDFKDLGYLICLAMRYMMLGITVVTNYFSIEAEWISDEQNRLNRLWATAFNSTEG